MKAFKNGKRSLGGRNFLAQPLISNNVVEITFLLFFHKVNVPLPTENVSSNQTQASFGIQSLLITLLVVNLLLKSTKTKKIKISIN